MTRSATAGRSPLPLVLAVVAVLAATCGGDDSSDGDYGVEVTTVSDPTTQDIRVFEPDADGSWPVVFALHGIDGSSEDLVELGTRLAQHGMLVFAPDYRTDLTTFDAQVELANDVECAYRYVRTIAAEHGGDLDRPVVFFGWSLGASFALQGTLVEDVDPTGEFIPCSEPAPRPDVVVAVSGCHDQIPVTLYDPNLWTNPAEVVLAAGEDDESCPPDQTRHAAQQLDAAGYDVDPIVLEGADHFAPVFHDLVDGEMVPSPDEAAGDRVVELIRDAVAAASEAEEE